jgi:hypothetical protein
MNKRIEKQLEATEIWFWKKTLKMPWTDKITNENILKQVNEKRRIIAELRNKQSRFIGYILRKGKLKSIQDLFSLSTSVSFPLNFTSSHQILHSFTTHHLTYEPALSFCPILFISFLYVLASLNT